MAETLPATSQEAGPARELDGDFDELIDEPELALEYAQDFLTQLAKAASSGWEGRPVPQGVAGYLLPDIPGGEGDIDTIRNVPINRDILFATDSRVFALVPQGQMIRVDSGEHSAYMAMTLSTCSAIVGYTEHGGTIAAHISVSLKDEVAAVMQYFEEQGVTPANTYVVLSDTPDFKGWNAPRVQDPGYFTARGIDPAHIAQFTYTEDYAGYSGLVDVTVGPQGVFMTHHNGVRTVHNKPRSKTTRTGRTLIVRQQ